MKTQFARLVLFFLVLITCFEASAQSIESEISELSTEEDIACYWEMILSTDQAYRSGTFDFYQTDCTVEPVADKHKVDSVDCLKRTVLMLKHHGFLNLEIFLPHVHSTPAIIIIHQKQPEFREYYFPIFRKHMRDGACSINETASVLQIIYLERIGLNVELTDEKTLDSLVSELGIGEMKVKYDLNIIDARCGK